MLGLLECYCSIVATQDGLEGTITTVEYKGNGIFICPKCDEKQDLSEHTYKLKVKIEEDEGYNVLKIIGGDERIHKHFYDDPSYLVIKDCIEDDLNEDMDHWLEKHERGLFELEVYYQPTSCMTDCGIEYDLEMFMLDEKRGEV